MTIRLAHRLQRVRPSPTVSITALATRLREAGRDIIVLSVGEPDFATPEHIKAAARDAIARNDTKYTAVDGARALKEAIVAKLKRDNRLEYAPEQILVSSGAKQSCYNACLALLDPGDEAIIPAPYWVSYPDMVRLADAEPVIVQAPRGTRFPDRRRAARGRDHAEDPARDLQQPVQSDGRRLLARETGSSSAPCCASIRGS